MANLVLAAVACESLTMLQVKKVVSIKISEISQWTLNKIRGLCWV